MKYTATRYVEEIGEIQEAWLPKVLARVNNHEVKLAKFEGDFLWHKHDGSDEAFLVVQGRMRIDFRDGSVEVGQGSMFVVPRGVEHKPFAEQECLVLMVESEGTQPRGN